MAHEWYTGVLTSSSWHGLEQVESIPDATTLIRRGEETGAYPVDVQTRPIVTVDGLRVPGAAVVAQYLDGARVAHAAVGEGYVALRPDAWRETIQAAVRAGARPAGAFALRGGTRILATFEVDSAANGIKSYLNLVDSLDGSLAHSCGGSSVRVVCANTLAISLGQDKGTDVRIRHTAGLHDRVEHMRRAMERYLIEGKSVAEMYALAEEDRLSRPDAEEIMAALFPEPTEEERKQNPRQALNRDKAREAIVIAMRRPENFAGPTLATVWNGATWLVDRAEDGTARRTRGGDPLDSLLFGSRGTRVTEIRRVIEARLAPSQIAA